MKTNLLMILSFIILSSQAFAIDCSDLAGTYTAIDAQTDFTLVINEQQTVVYNQTINSNGKTYQVGMYEAFKGGTTAAGDSCVAKGVFSKKLITGNSCNFSVEYYLTQDEASGNFIYSVKFMRPSNHIAKCQYNGYGTYEVDLEKEVVVVPPTYEISGKFSYDGGFKKVTLSDYTPKEVSVVRIDLIDSCGIEDVYGLSYSVDGEWYPAKPYTPTNEFGILPEHAGSVIEDFELSLNGLVDSSCDIPFLTK